MQKQHTPHLPDILCRNWHLRGDFSPPGCRGFTGPVPPPLWMRVTHSSFCQKGQNIKALDYVNRKKARSRHCVRGVRGGIRGEPQGQGHFESRDSEKVASGTKMAEIARARYLLTSSASGLPFPGSRRDRRRRATPWLPRRRRARRPRRPCSGPGSRGDGWDSASPCRPAGGVRRRPSARRCAAQARTCRPAAARERPKGATPCPRGRSGRCPWFPSSASRGS